LSLTSQVFNALSELEFDCDIWKQASFHALELLADSNDEPLVEAITYVLKAASQCQHIAQAVCLPSKIMLLSYFLKIIFSLFLLVCLSCSP
jgi:hypothetical protein